MQLNENDEALEIINRSLADGNLVGGLRCFALELAAKHAIYTKDYKKAAEYYEEALKVCNDPDVYKTKLAKVYMKLGQKKDVIELLDGLKNPFSILARAEAYIDRGEYAKANEELDNVTDDLLESFSPQKKEACMQTKNYLFGRLLQGQGQSSYALEYFMAANKGNSHSKVYYEAGLEAARINFINHDLSSSITLCDRIIKSTSDNYLLAKTTLLCGSVYLSRNELKKAEELFDATPVADVHYYGIAQVEMARSDYEHAFNALNAAKYASYDLYTRGLYSKLVIYFRQDRYNEFIDLYHIFKKRENAPKDLRLNADMMRLSLTVKFGKLNSYYPTTYTALQIVDYSEERTMENIISNSKIKTTGASFKNEQVINELYSEAKEKIASKEIRHISDGMFDRYKITKPGIGRMGDATLDSASIVTLPGTSNIISMFPIEKSGWALGNATPDICDITKKVYEKK